MWNTYFVAMLIFNIALAACYFYPILVLSATSIACLYLIIKANKEMKEEEEREKAREYLKEYYRNNKQ